MVASIFASPVFGLVGVWLGGHLQAKKDDARWKRELERENERWQRDDKRKWLDEQYRIYANLMGRVSEAMRATKLAFDMHPAYAAARQDETEALRRVDAAKIAVASVSPAVEAAALLGHTSITEEAWETYAAMTSVAFHGRRAEMPEMMRALGEARRSHSQLRALIRQELGIDQPGPPGTDDEGDEGDESF